MGIKVSKRKPLYFADLETGDCFYLKTGHTYYQKVFDKIHDEYYMVDLEHGTLWPVSTSQVVPVQVDMVVTE